MKILVCDDKSDQCNRTVSKIACKATVVPLAEEKLKEALTTFFEGVADVLEGKSMPDNVHWAEKFDDYDVIVVDNNLTDLDLSGARLTAETVIGYLRAFTNIPYIVSLNKNLHVDFDLRYLYGDYQSLADIALNTEHLSNSCLWGATDESRFSPWYWPQLGSASNQRRKQVKFINENFNESVWHTLGFPESADEYLSPHAKDKLVSDENEDPTEATFFSFFKGSQSLPPAEKETLLNFQDQTLVRQAIHRITAYEVDRWIRRYILGPQDVLIDVPHLVAQMPHLLGAGSASLCNWNATVNSEKAPFDLDVEIFNRFLNEAQFEMAIWAPNPCFWWPSLKINDELMEQFYASDSDWPDAVFCEDISRFVDIADEEASHSLREFDTEIAGSWGRRFISYDHEFSYSPPSRMHELLI